MLTISWPILLSSPQAPTHSLNRPAGHIPLCLVQHDDRSEAELLTERSLIDLNQAVCARDSGCRYVFTRQHFDPTVEPHWQKLFAVRAALDTGCQHAVWLDSDVVVLSDVPLQLDASSTKRWGLHSGFVIGFEQRVHSYLPPARSFFTPHLTSFGPTFFAKTFSAA